VIGSIADVAPQRCTISLDSHCLSAIKNWKVGGTYEIHLKVRETAVHEDDYDGKKVLHATFEVKRAGGSMGGMSGVISGAPSKKVRDVAPKRKETTNKAIQDFIGKRKKGK
jgi:hypothetical protein